MAFFKNLVFAIVLTTSFVGIASQSIAEDSLTLESAKSQGFIGERADGLIGIVNPPGSLEIQDLVKDINEKRLLYYMEEAKRQKVALITIKNLAGKKLREATPVGQYIYTGGQWKPKQVFGN